MQNPGWAWAALAEILAVLRNLFLGFPGCLYRSCKRILGLQYCDVPVGEFWYRDIVIRRAVLVGHPEPALLVVTFNVRTVLPVECLYIRSGRNFTWNIILLCNLKKFKNVLTLLVLNFFVSVLWVQGPCVLEELHYLKYLSVCLLNHRSESAILTCPEGLRRLTVWYFSSQGHFHILVNSYMYIKFYLPINIWSIWSVHSCV